jgi:predicted membrane protein
MEIHNQNEEQGQGSRWNRHDHYHSPMGKIFAGILVVGVGAVLLAKQMGVDFPHWLLSWKMMLIALGFYLGFKHAFRNLKWLIPIVIGGVFLIEDFFPGTEIHTFFWPIMLMFVGLIIIFKPRNRNHEKWRRWKDEYREKWDGNCGSAGFNSSDDLLDAVAVFGSVKKNIISKDFKGGEATCCFGGAMINLTQADINGKAVLELNAVFGGIKLYVPQHWQVQTAELVTVMGGIDDKRGSQNASINSDKILVLRGSAVFGGIEILN